MFDSSSSTRGVLWSGVMMCLAFLFVFASAGAAEPAPASAPGSEAEKALRKRVKEYWDLRVARSEDVLQYYTEPDRPTASMGELGAVKFEEYEIKDVHLREDEEAATVVVRVKLDFSWPPVVSRLSEKDREAITRPVMPEAWHLVDGIWYRQAVRPGLSRLMGKPGSTRVMQPSPATPDAPETPVQETGQASPEEVQP